MIISQVSPNTNSITLLNTKTECTCLYKLNITKAWIAARTFFYNLLQRNNVSKASKQILHKFLKASGTPSNSLWFCVPLWIIQHLAHTSTSMRWQVTFMGTCLSTLHDLQGLRFHRSNRLSDFGLHRIFDHGKGGTVKPREWCVKWWEASLHRNDSRCGIRWNHWKDRMPPLHLDTKSPQGISPLSVKHVLIVRNAESHHLVMSWHVT